eukprot:3834727-Rhodomonas_salina.1
MLIAPYASSVPDIAADISTGMGGIKDEKYISGTTSTGIVDNWIESDLGVEQLFHGEEEGGMLLVVF